MQEPPQKIGRYSIIRELGRGGMGAVYLGLDEKLERKVALKVIANLTDSSERRFSFEGQLLAKLNHPNVVQLYDVVEETERTALVMEYIEGNTLGQRLNMQPSRALKLKWLKEVSDGLAAAHKQGIAHCDLKLENVLIDKHNVAKIADFGIAKRGSHPTADIDSNKTITASYTSLSPEMLAGLPTDEKTDLFALGNLIHQTLTGTHAYGDHKDQTAFIKRIQNGAHSLDTQSRESLGIRLYDLVENLIQVKPSERVYTALEVAAVVDSELQYSQISEDDDLTIEIPVSNTTAIKSTETPKSGLLKSLGLVVAGFLVGVLLLKLWSFVFEENQKHSYIAIIPYEIEFDESVSEKQATLIGSTIRNSVEQAVLDLRNTSLVPSNELRGIDRNAATIAKVTQTNQVLEVQPTCNNVSCSLKLLKYSGQNMGVTAQRSWPVTTQSLLGLRDSISREISILLNAELSKSGKISETDFSEFMQIVADSDNGREPTFEQLSRLKILSQQQPDFFPTYQLARRMGERLFAKNSASDYVAVISTMFSSMPERYHSDPSYLSGIFSLALLRRDYESARDILEQTRLLLDDPVRLLEFEIDLAYYSGADSDLLKLDRKAANLRPSAKNLYNLATSEYSFGNHEAAREAVERSLLLDPNYAFALNLRGTIQMSSGELDEAIAQFTQSLTIKERTTTLSNLSLAYLLKGELENAEANVLRALELSPNISSYHLNYADILKLRGEATLAATHYQKVIELTEELNRGSDYVRRVQALAQLGHHAEAIKLLNAGFVKHPNQATLRYSAALAHTLADNKIAAIVAAEEAINKGTGRVWFSLPWFRSLCGNETFENLINNSNNNPC